MWISRGNILHSNRPNASQLSCSISLLMFPTGSCHQPSALASFCDSPESPPCRSSLMLAGKLGGVHVVRQVEDRWFDPSESFGEAIKIWTVGLSHHVWFWTIGWHTLFTK